MNRLADWIWRRPAFCRVSREHVPDPAELFMHDAQCLRCGRVYDDGVAQHRHQVARAAQAPRMTVQVDRRARVRSAS